VARWHSAHLKIVRSMAPADLRTSVAELSFQHRYAELHNLQLD
jgi:hypothetical protein